MNPPRLARISYFAEDRGEDAYLRAQDGNPVALLPGEGLRLSVEAIARTIRQLEQPATWILCNPSIVAAEVPLLARDRIQGPQGRHHRRDIDDPSERGSANDASSRQRAVSLPATNRPEHQDS